jgi:hypothetical protein
VRVRDNKSLSTAQCSDSTCRQIKGIIDIIMSTYVNASPTVNEKHRRKLSEYRLLR